MIRKKRYLAAKMGLLALGLMLLFPGQAEAADKKTIYNSPYVSFSPDGKAFTTCAGDQNYTWYAEDDSTTVYSGIKSSLRSLRTGEHYYKVARWGEVPVGSWKVVHRPGQCIHDGYTSDENWHGIQFGTQKCMQYYYSGWKAFCADCGEPLEDSNIYMSREAASSIQYLDLGSEKNPVFYYYLCPFCRNLEQGVGLSAHWCKEISWNQYRVVYKANSGVDGYNGYMDYSYHMYNNETIYEGETVTPVTHLTENNYTRVGYVFTGWNTKQDGSGVSFTDKEEIYNLSSSDWNDQSTWTDTDRGTITLYAQWRKSESTLVIDANGGRYNGVDKYSLTEPYSSKYLLQKNLIVSPNGYTVAFETNGGTNVDTITGTMHFVEWMQIQPFNGFVTNDTYMFMAPDRNIDTLKAVYQSDPITLPVTTKDGWSFGGWYYDPDFSLPAGGAGDQIIPSKDMTLYAQWVDLRQMDQILNGINDGLQPLLVAQYANPKIPAWQMDIYRYGMLNGLGYDQIKVGCLQDWDSSRNNIDNMIKEQRGHIVSDLKANNYIPEKRLVHKIGRLNGLTGGKFNKVSDIVNSVKSGKISNRYGEASLLKEIGDDLQHQRKI